MIRFTSPTSLDFGEAPERRLVTLRRADLPDCARFGPSRRKPEPSKPAKSFAPKKPISQPRQSLRPLQALRAKIIVFTKIRIRGLSRSSRCLQEGRIAIVTDVGGGMRWTRRAARDEGRARGRLNRMVLTPRRWRQVLARRIAGATGANKPGTPGRVRHRPLKPIAQGRPACCGVPVVTCLRAFFTCTQGYGCDPRIRPSLRPPDFSRDMSMQNPGASRGAAEVCLLSCRHCERSDLSAEARRAKAEAIHVSTS
jgi:hypothetical protein